MQLLRSQTNAAMLDGDQYQDRILAVVIQGTAGVAESDLSYDGVNHIKKG